MLKIDVFRISVVVVCLLLWSMGHEVIEKRDTLKDVQNMEGRISEISILHTLLKA